MNNKKENAVTAEEILNSKPYFKQGLDKHFGYETIINAMNEFSASQNAELVKEVDRLNEIIEHDHKMFDVLHKEKDEQFDETESLGRAIESWKKEEIINNEWVSDLQQLLSESQSKANKLAEVLQPFIKLADAVITNGNFKEGQILYSYNKADITISDLRKVSEFKGKENT